MKKPFAKIALDDRVWSTHHGWGTIVTLYPKDMLFSIQFDNHTTILAYYTSGKRKYGEHTQERTLFWEEQNMKQQFTNIKIGDRVWSINYGWGSVVSTESIIFAVLHKTNTVWYHYNGMENYPMTGIVPTLFWDEIHITPPPRPAAPVTHTIERWVNLYPSFTSVPYDTEEDANKGYLKGRNENIHEPRIATVRLTGTYTTMEGGE